MWKFSSVRTPGILFCGLLASACVAEPDDDGDAWSSAPGVTVERIALYQGVERDLMLDGELVEGSTVPLVEGRPGVVRVFYSTDGEYDGEQVTGRLTVGDEVFESEPTFLEESSDPDDLDSTINVSFGVDDLPGGELSWSVDLVQEGDFASEGAARYPREGASETEVEAAANVLRVVIVPFSYEADGSGRVPNLDDEQVEKIRRYFHKLYPVTDVELGVRDVVPFASALGPDGSGWFNAGLATVAARNEDGADEDVYYYGMFNPTETLQQFCFGGCLLGVTLLNDEPADIGNPQFRIAIGVGFESRAADVAAHELGHSHGRGHAPCGPGGSLPDGIDPSYPYDDGVIGVHGHDFYEDELLDPSDSTDIMGYCDDQWVSDYQYRALHERGQNVNLP